MVLFPKRPIIHEKAVHQALEAMRTGRKLRAHPLQISVIITSRLASPRAVSGEVAGQVAIFDYLREVITGRYIVRVAQQGVAPVGHTLSRLLPQ